MTHSAIPRGTWGDVADALGVPDDAGRELHSTAGEGVPGSRTSSGAGGKLHNTDTSLRHGNPVRGGTSPAS